MGTFNDKDIFNLFILLLKVLVVITNKTFFKERRPRISAASEVLKI
jgi:hypothetical protein